MLQPEKKPRGLESGIEAGGVAGVVWSTITCPRVGLKCRGVEVWNSQNPRRYIGRQPAGAAAGCGNYTRPVSIGHVGRDRKTTRSAARPDAIPVAVVCCRGYARQGRGFALFLREPGLRCGYLEFISVTPGTTGDGRDGILYGPVAGRGGIPWFAPENAKGPCARCSEQAKWQWWLRRPVWLLRRS